MSTQPKVTAGGSGPPEAAASGTVSVAPTQALTSPPHSAEPDPRVSLSARARQWALPAGLLLPATAVLVLVLGYPIVRMVTLSLQQAKLRDLVRETNTWNGGQNYIDVWTDPYFWTVTLRTITFAFVCVAATMVLGLGIALLMRKLGTKMRVTLSVGLLMAWATPALTATQVWQWIFDTQFGIVNWALVALGFEQFENHSWLAEPLSLLGVAAIIVVWGGIPFVALTIFAGLTQIPDELFEAAELDGASGLKLLSNVVLPLIGPILTILAALSTIWDFRVFTQVFILQKAGGITKDTDLLGIYAYRTSFAGNNFGTGSAIGVSMVILLLGVSVFYVRRMMKEINQ